ncbi:MAG: TM2 domain-containing protein [Clostridia bacterium]|nr:TM2 domain-containing protein [Clostridia bacterium]
MQQKKRVTAGLFAFLLGAYGVHDFYLGYTKKAILHLVMMIVSIFSAVLCIIPYFGFIVYFAIVLPLCIANSAWCIVEGIKIFSNKNFVDARGNTLA